MYQFLETIQLRDGAFKRLAYHQLRMESAMSGRYPDAPVPLLNEILHQVAFPLAGLYKCRVIYDSEIRKIEFHPYSLPVIRSLKIVETDMPSLPYKPADRSGFHALFAQRGDCDDVLLVKNGLLTDTSYCNIALYDGKYWFTPRVPLLTGVNRAQLLAEGRLIEKDIKVEELVNFQCIVLFNALIDFGAIQFDISAICP